MLKRQVIHPTIGKTSLPDLLAAVPEVTWVRLARSGAVVYCNGAYERLWRRPMSELEADPESWKSAVHEEDRAGLIAALERAGPDERFEQEYRIIGPDADWRWVRDRAWAVRERQDTELKLVGSVQDISGQKGVETALRTALDALNSSVNGVVLTDRVGNITYANPSFLKLFGFASESETIGLPVKCLFSGKGIEDISDLVADVARAGAVAKEYRVRAKDGSERMVEVLSSDVHDLYGQRVGSMAAFLDITERKMLQLAVQEDWRRLRLLTDRLAMMEEQERRRISTQLHDTAVQSFSLASIKLGALGQSLRRSGQHAQEAELGAVRELITRGIRECRLIMADLIPPLLYEVGLDAALRQFAERLRRLYRVTIHLDAESEVDVPEWLRGVFFQAARELVMNACKHADAANIRIAWQHSPEWYCMEVVDDGKGFDPARSCRSQPTENSGFGLFSIQERVRSLGGRLLLDSQPGKGTIVRVWLPCRNAAPRSGGPPRDDATGPG